MDLRESTSHDLKFNFLLLQTEILKSCYIWMQIGILLVMQKKKKKKKKKNQHF